MFLRNAWYVAAWDHELADGMLARTFLGEDVVLYRDSQGDPAALEDRCCHRHLPLSEGVLLGDRVQCGYHGLEFDRSGACVQIPGQSRIPPGAALRAYPVVERYRWIWIWMGDPAAADPDLIPDYHWNDDPDWAAFGDRFYVEGDYRLMNDNLLDLSHIQFLHASTLGAASDEEAEIAVDRRPECVQVTRWVVDTEPAPFYKVMLGSDDNVDRWHIITYRAPGSVIIDAGNARTGTGARDGDRSHSVETYSNHFLTPETGTTTHYFWHHARNFRIDDAGLTDNLQELFASALMEDVVAIKAQQASIDRLGDRPTVDINVDNGGLQGRRMLDAMIAAEREAADAAE